MDASFKDILKKNLNISEKPDEVVIATMTITCKLNINFFVENIAKYIDINNECIFELIHGKDIHRKAILKNKSKKSKKKNFFFNQVTLKIKTNIDKEMNIKLFKNGSIQMTGCKSVDGVIEGLELLFTQLRKQKYVYNTVKKNITFKPFINDVNMLEIKNIYDINIAMINSSFKIGFKIDRTKLYNIMSSENINVIYDSMRHAGVNISYKYNNKITSILIFESGSIVITGARDCEQIKNAYEYINKYLLTNYQDIIINDYVSFIESNYTYLISDF